MAGLTGITQVAAGAFFSLALRSDGTVWAWGDNRNGQLGRKTVTDHEVTPARVAVLNHVTKIAAGNDFALALRSDGIVFAWGLGQLGPARQRRHGRQPVPVKIAGLSRVTGIAAGWEASLATENNGVSALTSVWAWGGNEDGELGDGTLAGHATPERVTGLPVYIAGLSAATGSPRSWAPTARSGTGARTGSASWASPRIPRGDPARERDRGRQRDHPARRRRRSHARAEVRRHRPVLGLEPVGPARPRPGGPGQRRPGPVTGLGATQVSAGWQSSYAVHTVLGS